MTFEVIRIFCPCRWCSPSAGSRCPLSSPTSSLPSLTALSRTGTCSSAWLSACGEASSSASSPSTSPPTATAPSRYLAVPFLLQSPVHCHVSFPAIVSCSLVHDSLMCAIRLALCHTLLASCNCKHLLVESPSLQSVLLPSPACLNARGKIAFHGLVYPVPLCKDRCCCLGVWSCSF